MALWAAHRQTAATEREDGNKSPPAAPITEHAHLTEGRQSTPWEGWGGGGGGGGGGKTLARARAHDDVMGSRVR